MEKEKLGFTCFGTYKIVELHLNWRLHEFERG